MPRVALQQRETLQVWVTFLAMQPSNASAIMQPIIQQVKNIP